MKKAGNILIAVGFALGVFGGYLVGLGSATQSANVAGDVALDILIGPSEIVEAGPFPALEQISPFDERYIGVKWLESRASFNNSGLAILGYDMLVTAIAGVDRMAAELQACEANRP